MSLAQQKVPVVVATGLICFVIGAGAGAVGLSVFGSQWIKPRTGTGVQADDETRKTGGTGGGLAARRGPGGPGGPGGPSRIGGSGGPGVGGRRGPNSKNRLAELVVKLDQLTGKPLGVTLSAEQQAKLCEQLHGLEKQETLSEEDAGKRLTAILEIVKDDRATLEAAGYRWPGPPGGFQPPPDVPNPFKEEANGEHLKALQQRVTKKE
jgi:hypothetical protein